MQNDDLKNNTPIDANNVLAEVIRSGNHKQFIYDNYKERVECRCGHIAVWWRTGFVCGTITAYPCKFN